MKNESLIPDMWARQWLKDIARDLEFYKKFDFSLNYNLKGGDKTVDYKTAKEEAIAEVKDEETQKAKREYKLKLKELAGAKKVVTNIERELEDLDDKYGSD